MVTQAETGRTGTVVKIREWLALIGAVVVILGGLLGGMRLVVAPLYTEMQALNGRMDLMREELKVVRGEIGSVRDEIGSVRGEIGSVRDEVNDLRQDMNDEFKAVRSDIAALSERMTRVETLLERDTGRSGTSDALDARP